MSDPVAVLSKQCATMRCTPAPTPASTSRSLLVVAALALVACGENEYAPPPLPSVTGAQPAVSDVVSYLEYTGTTRAVEAVTVRARVEGFLQSMYFEPGDVVELGAPLFLIDPEPFELALKAANANVTSRKAELDLAETEFERTRSLYERNATSEIKYIQTRAQRDTAAAMHALAEADARAAELDVEYANVTAPIAGRVGRNLVDMGNLVGGSEATALTELIDYSPLYVYFYISERDLLAIQETSARRREQLGVDYDHRPPTPIYVARANDEGYPHVGTVNYSALQIDSATGTFEVRGILENSGSLDEIIVPGTFVRVQVPVGRVQDALLVPARALGADQNGRFLLVVSREGVVEQRSVTVGNQRRDGLRVVSEGLSADDWVIIDGLQRARPGAKVTMEKSTTPAPEAPRERPAPASEPNRSHFLEGAHESKATEDAEGPEAKEAPATEGAEGADPIDAAKASPSATGEGR